MRLERGERDPSLTGLVQRVARRSSTEYRAGAGNAMPEGSRERFGSVGERNLRAAGGRSALPPEEEGEGRAHRSLGAGQIGEQRARDLRRCDEPGVCLIGEIVPGDFGMGLGVTDDGDVTEARIPFAKRSPVEPQSIERPGTDRRQQQVGLVEQRAEGRAIAAVLEVEPADAHCRRELSVPRRTPAFERIARNGLDFRHIGTELREAICSHRPGYVDGEADDSHALQWRDWYHDHARCAGSDSQPDERFIQRGDPILRRVEAERGRAACVARRFRNQRGDLMHTAKAVLLVALEAATLSGCALQAGQSASLARPGDRDTLERLTRLLQDTAPNDQPAAGDALARRQADAAMALFRLGHADMVWPLLRHSPDPTRRTYIILALARSVVDPALLLQRLGVERDASIRRALILSLGQFSGEQLPLGVRQPLVADLLQSYRDDPDPGVHASIDWLLRYGRQGERPRAFDWKQAAALAAIDREMAGRPADGRGWYVTTESQTMVIISGPVEFRMGSPANEPGRVAASDSPDEPLHRVRIPRSFAIAAKETTVGQFRRFLDANPEVKRRHSFADNSARMTEVLQRFSPDDEGPQIAMTWYEAALYCNWLSRQERIPVSEWVYPASVDEMRSGVMLPKDYLHRAGYRLPTEAEWEYATRAGSHTSRFYGTSDSLLGEFAWYSRHPPKQKADPIDPSDPQRTWPVGQLMPNDFGLFDVYGNVWEWTHDRMQQHQTNMFREDVEDGILMVSDSVARSRRGGGFPYEAAKTRSAERGTVNAFPFLRRDNVGFRIARSLPATR